MTALLVILALLSSLIGGTVAFFTVGTIGAVVFVLLIFALMGAALYLRGVLVKVAVATMAVIAIAAAGFGGLSAFELVSALETTRAPPTPPIPPRSRPARPGSTWPKSTPASASN